MLICLILDMEGLQRLDSNGLLNFGGEANGVMNGADTDGAVVDGGTGPPVEKRPAAETKGSPLPELPDSELSSPVME
jgi:hypothetical protein